MLALMLLSLGCGEPEGTTPPATEAEFWEAVEDAVCEHNARCVVDYDYDACLIELQGMRAEHLENYRTFFGDEYGEPDCMDEFDEDRAGEIVSDIAAGEDCDVESPTAHAAWNRPPYDCPTL